jgi:hypothetical protein
MPDLELRADYDHDGRLSGSQPEYDARATPPGAIAVANVDADRRPLPRQVSAGPAVTLDYQQPTKSGVDDELLPLRVRVLNPAAAAGRQLLLRVGPPQAVRVRLYDDRGTILPTPDAARPGDHPLPPPPTAGADVDVLLELRTYPGSPFPHAILLETIFVPPTTREWPFTVQLVARDGAGNETVLDAGSFSAAPILFLDNGVPATRLYICDTPDTQASLTDLRAALPALGGVQLIPVPEAVANGDTWLQDQFQPGVVFDGSRRRHAIVHLPRLRANFFATQSPGNLAAFVRSHFPARDVGLLDDFWAREMHFADSSGRAVDLPFRDCIALSNVMARVPALFRSLGDRVTTIDDDPPFPPGTWSELRNRLPALAEEFAARAARAHRDGQTAWNRMLEDWTADARANARAIVAGMPPGSSPGSFSIAAGSATVELGGELADRVFARVQQLEGSGNYGGNIESAPPTPTAPLGSIVVGNALVRDEADHVDPDLLGLLYAQAQPVVEVDSTWLDVGHVDEMLTFVPSRGGSGLPFAALRASSKLALDIVRAAADRYRAGLKPDNPQTSPDFLPSGVGPRLTRTGPSPVTRLLRGKLWLHLHPQAAAGTLPDVLEPPRIYQRLAQVMNGGGPLSSSSPYNVHGIRFWPGPGPERVYPADITVLELLFCERDGDRESTNDFIESEFLAPVDKVLAERIGDVAVFPLPVLFDRTGSVSRWEKERWSASTSAFTPDLVNLQALGGHLLMPRPYGPRMRPPDAQAVLEEVLETVPAGEALRRRLTPGLLSSPALRHTVAWVLRHDGVRRTVDSIGSSETVFNGLTTIDDVALAFADGFPGMAPAAVADRIRGANQRQFTPAGELREGWRRLVFDEGTVDLFEAYVQLVAGALGLTVDWIDSWFFHTHFGGIHCGTNVLREPAPGTPPPRWWA